MREIIDAEGRQALLDYKYVSSWSSRLDLEIMNPFWETVVLAVPMNIAPNVLTVSATLVFMIAYSIWLYFSPKLNNDCPSWVYFLLSISLFIYQTLDAIDGKQARRTKSSSPLGQLFDHGNDAFAFTQILISALGSMNFGLSWMTWITLQSGYLVFYLVNWRARHEGVMHHPPFGITEAQFVGVAIYFITGLFGRHVWDFDPLMGLLGDSFNFRMAVAIFMIGQTLIVIITEIRQLSAFFKKNPSKKDKGSRIELIHLSLWSVASALWFAAGAMTSHPRTYIWTQNFLFSGLVHRLIVADVTHMKTNPYPFLLWMQPIIIVGSILELVFDSTLYVGSVSEMTFMSIILAHSFIFWLGYVTKVINEICETCNIYLFTIGKRSQN